MGALATALPEENYKLIYILQKICEAMRQNFGYWNGLKRVQNWPRNGFEKNEKKDKKKSELKWKKSAYYLPNFGHAVR